MEYFISNSATFTTEDGSITLRTGNDNTEVLLEVRTHNVTASITLDKKELGKIIPKFYGDATVRIVHGNTILFASSNSYDNTEEIQGNSYTIIETMPGIKESDPPASFVATFETKQLEALRSDFFNPVSYGMGYKVEAITEPKEEVTEIDIDFPEAKEATA